MPPVDRTKKPALVPLASVQGDTILPALDAVAVAKLAENFNINQTPALSLPTPPACTACSWPVFCMFVAGFFFLTSLCGKKYIKAFTCTGRTEAPWLMRVQVLEQLEAVRLAVRLAVRTAECLSIRTVDPSRHRLHSSASGHGVNAHLP